MKKYIYTLLMSLMLFACSFAPKYEQPEMDLPDTWGELEEEEKQYDGSLWWQRFNDETLNALVEEGVQKNKDLEIAFARIEQMRASWGVESSRYFPTLGTTVGASVGTQSKQLYPMAKSNQQQYELSVGLNYEIDFWGKIRNLSDVAKAQYLSTRAAKEIVRLNLISNIVTTYFDIITLEQQEMFLVQITEALKKQLLIKQQELRFGAITPVDVKQMEATVASFEAQKAGLASALIEARSSLLLLLGRSPREMITKKLSFKESVIDFTRDYEIPAGLPANVLVRRPDIYQAEQSIRSANANIGVARAMYFPSISLAGVVGLLSGNIGKLFTDSFMWSAGVTSSAPLFSGGKIINQNLMAEAVQKEAIAQYQLTVQNAYKDVITSLSQLKQTKIALESATKETEAYEITLQLAEAQLKAGAISMFQVLTIAQNYIESQDRLLQAQRNRILAVVNSYKSLGGDWEDPDKKKQEEDSQKNNTQKIEGKTAKK